MTPRRTALARLLYAAVLILATAFLFLAPIRFEFGLFELAQGGEPDARLEMLKSNSAKIRIAAASKDKAALLAVASEISNIISQGGASSDIKSTLGVLQKSSIFLLSEQDRAALMRGEFGQIRSRAENKILSPYSNSLFKISKDPFFLLDGYAKSLTEQGGGWQARDGFLFKQEGGNFYAALMFNSQKLSDAGLKIALEKLDLIKEKSAKSGVQIYISGARIHSLHASEKSKKEINILSAISLSLIAVLGLWAFGTPKIFLPVALCMASAFAIALAAAGAVFGAVHVCVLIFATSLIGLSIDYSYHYFQSLKNCQDPDAALQKISVPLKNTLITTLLCFFMLCFSDLTLLRQISVFSIFGLLGAYFFARLFYPPLAKILKPKFAEREINFGRIKIGKKAYWALCAALLAASAFGIFRAEFKTSAKDLYTPQKDLVFADIEAAKILDFGSKKLALIKAGSADGISKIEEKCGICGVSRFVPSIKRQIENAKLAEALYENQAQNLQKNIGSKKKIEPPNDCKFLTAQDFDGTPIAAAISSMLVVSNGKYAAIVPVANDFEGGEDVEIFEPAKFLDGVFNSHMRAAKILACASFAVLIAAFAMIFRRRFLKLALPLALSVGAAVCAQALFAGGVNLFHILALFILMGLGVDYAIFHSSSGSNGTKNAVLISFATSVAGFGALAFTSFGAISSIGSVLAVGLAAAYLISFLGAENG